MVLADWIRVSTGIDPATEFRGTYNDEAGAERHIERHGGLIHLVEMVLRRHGFTTVDQPVTGDVVVVRAPCRNGVMDTGAIVVGNRRALFTPDIGLVMAPLPVRAAWEVPCRK